MGSLARGEGEGVKTGPRESEPRNVKKGEKPRCETLAVDKNERATNTMIYTDCGGRAKRVGVPSLDE